MRTLRLFAASALCGLLALGMQGCILIGVRVGEEIPPGQVARIVPGETTKDDVLRWFGAPVQATDGEIFARMFDAGEIAAEDLVALPFADFLVYEITDGNGRFIITILFNWGEVKLKRDRLTIFFDENDVVLYYGVTRQREYEADDESGGASEADERDERLDGDHAA
jgi:hypothetical protein